jgi:hypothetical protein
MTHSIAFTVISSVQSMVMCSHERGCTAGAGCKCVGTTSTKCHAPQVYVHYNVKTAEGQLLQSTWQAEGGAGLPLPFIIGAGRRAPRAWEIAFLSALTQPAACCMSQAVLPLLCVPPFSVTRSPLHGSAMLWGPSYSLQRVRTPYS